MDQRSSKDRKVDRAKIDKLLTSAVGNTTKDSEDDCQQIICRDGQHDEYLQMAGRVDAMEECPMNIRTLGRASWSLMHTFAAYYPQQPSEQQKQTMKGWLEGFKQMYPCSHCRPHFAKDYERDPPNLESRKELSLWVCRQHNNVNKILGKSQFDCSYEVLMKRWRTGCSQSQDQL